MRLIFLLSFFILLIIPITQSISVKEISTTCDLFDCETILEVGDVVFPPEYFGNTKPLDFDKNIHNLIPYKINLKESLGIKTMDLEILNKNQIKISGKIQGATNNYWGIETIYNSSWWNSSWGECFDIAVKIPTNRKIIDEPVTINLTGLTFTNASKEIRIIDQPCSNNGNVALFDFVQDSGNIGDGDEWVKVLFVFSNTSQSGYQNYSVYSNNPTAEYIEDYRPQTNDIWDYYFNATLSPTVDGWSKGGGFTAETVEFDGDYKRIHWQDDNGNTYYGKSFPCGSPYTIEAQIKINYTTWADAGNGIIIQAHDNDNRGYLQANNYTQLENLGDSTEFYRVPEMQYTYRTVRMIVEENNVSIWVDNVFYGDVSSSDTASNYIRFYVYANDGNTVQEFWDYWTYTNGSKIPLETIQGGQETPDLQYPQWYNNQSEINNVNQTSFFNITCTDDVAIDSVLIEGNFTNTSANYTMNNSFGGDIFNYSYYFNESLTYYWKSYCIDTSSQENATDSWIFTIISTSTTTTTIPREYEEVDYCQMVWAKENYLSNHNTCLDNYTLMHNLTYIANDNLSYVYTYESCNWGCDNTTMSCSPNPMNQNFIVLGVILGIVFILFVVVNRLGRGL